MVIKERAATKESIPASQRAERVLPTTPLRERSLGELFATLSRDLALLIHQEIELAKTEAKIGAIKAGAGIAGLVVALILLPLALVILSVAAALGIHALGLSLGWSFLVIGGAWALLALVAAGAGAFALRKVKVQKRAVDSMKADLQALARKPNPIPPVD
jgi:hypothetical protein